MQFEPHEYQQTAIDFILSHKSAALLLDMGLGKTVITLTALKELLDAGEVKHILVAAPLRVARDTWPQELAKWAHLQGITFAVATGTPKQRTEAICRKAQITVINRENLPWLVSQRWPVSFYDCLVLDELSNYRNITCKRSKAALRIAQECGRVIGLTGTPAAKGLADLWSQYRILDGGECLGKSYMGFMRRYFTPYYHKYRGDIEAWELKEGAEEHIYQAIAPITLSMQAIDHLTMPEKIESSVHVQLPPGARSIYDGMRANLALSLPEGSISAKDCRVLTGKLQQLANGTIYDDEGNAFDVHAEKIDALEQLLQEAAGRPVLIAYNYRHDLERIAKLLWYGGYNYGVLDDERSIAAWCRGELEVGLIHPMSAGHGLNLQSGGATIIWYGLPWSLELYQQTNARLYRQGQQSKAVVIRHIIADDTIDERILAVLKKRGSTQQALIDAVKEEICK